MREEDWMTVLLLRRWEMAEDICQVHKVALQELGVLKVEHNQKHLV